MRSLDPDTKAQLDDEEWLKANLPPRNISVVLGCSMTPVMKALDVYGLRPARKSRVPEHVTSRLNDAEWLSIQYETRTAKSIADELGCSDSTVRTAMHRLGIPMREGKFLHDHEAAEKLHDRKWLESEYARDSLAGIGANLGVSSAAVSRAMTKLGIPKRAAGSLLRPDTEELLDDRDWLIDQYLDKGHSAETIGKEIGVHLQTVLARLRGYDVEIRGRNELTSGEQEIAELCRGAGFQVEQNRSGLIGRHELDIFIPSKNLAIEFNGVYWHSSKYKSQDYHAIKLQKCQSSGIRLIQVWEHDWKSRRGIVERMILHKLGASKGHRSSARSLSVCSVSCRDARTFLRDNHIQGYAGGSVRLGLTDEAGEIVALMVFRSNGNKSWELTRFATSEIVRGGFGKLLSYFKGTQEWTEIISFADLCLSDGSIYASSGFTLDRILLPDYKYLVRGELVHKSNYRLSRFRSDPNLIFEPGLTERQLAEKNKLLRVYDAGKMRFTLRQAVADEL